MNDVGRNDPCPCGSGKKFKRCCLLNRSQPSSAFTRDERQAALGELFYFAERAEFDTEHAAAEDEFWADRLDDLDDDVADETFELDQSQAAYLEWFSFDFRLSTGGTVLERFLDRSRSRLRPGEARYLERMRSSHLRTYEVTEVQVDEGLNLLDLWTGERLRISERLATHQVVQWDLIAARVIIGEDDVPVMEGTPYLYPVDVKAPMLRALRRAHREFRRKFHAADLSAFFKRMGPLYHLFWLDHVALRPLPKVVTPEGDEFVFARVTLEVRDREKLVAALGQHPDLQRQVDGSYVWLDRARGTPPSSLGVFRIEHERLVLEATSQPRADRGRRFVEALAGDAIRYRATSFEGVERAMERTPPPADNPSRDIPLELQAQLVADVHERHYRAWPDTRLPALGDRTPREMAQHPAGRAKVVALLKQMENLAARQRQQGQTAYDVGWLWAELGVERPG